jgi:guanosine-3',5'-bis(diphosphate) 3'-pyrophosphohydrolase
MKSKGAALIKVADKICNLRDLRDSPPKHWTVKRKRNYCDWAMKVVTRLPKTNSKIVRYYITESKELLRAIA